MFGPRGPGGVAREVEAAAVEHADVHWACRVARLTQAEAVGCDREAMLFAGRPCRANGLVSLAKMRDGARRC
jgi:hypothetical protein